MTRMNSKRPPSQPFNNTDETSAITPSKSLRFVAWAYGLTVGAYLLYFGIFLGYDYSKTPSDWALFGDFIGGVLNPLIACSALYWLAKSISIQQNELKETKKALEKSAESQSKLAELQASQNQLLQSQNELTEKQALAFIASGVVEKRKIRISFLQSNIQSSITNLDILSRERSSLIEQNDRNANRTSYVIDRSGKNIQIQEALVEIDKKEKQEFDKLNESLAEMDNLSEQL